MFYSIHACRALAAMLVVCFHVAENLAKDKYFGNDAQFLATFFSFGGLAGVAFFFVLSGFIISHAHGNDLGRPEKLFNYFFRRIVRIYPIYFVVFFVVYLAALCFPSLRDTVPHDLSVVIKSLLLVPQDRNVIGGTGAPVIVVAWSLQYEILFYIIFGLGVFNKKLFFLIFSLLCGLVLLNSFFIDFIFPLSFVASPLVLLFGFGVLASRISKSSLSFDNHAGLVFVTLVLFLLVAILNVFLGKSHSDLFSVVYGLISAALIVFLVSWERHRPSLFKSRIFMILGESSYSLYLIHFPLISVLSKIAISIGVRGSFFAFISAVSLFFICLFFGILFNRYIELFFQRKFARKTVPTALKRNPT